MASPAPPTSSAAGHGAPAGRKGAKLNKIKRDHGHRGMIPVDSSDGLVYDDWAPAVANPESASTSGSARTGKGRGAAAAPPAQNENNASSDSDVDSPLSPDDANPNRTGTPSSLTKRERAAQGKAALQVQADAARLAIIRKEREEAALKRQQEQEAKRANAAVPRVVAKPKGKRV
ncbi:hypothetical protein AMAG_13084 [Allomyces macrogynus ATCC 38327]|uniref:Casein kinase substrate phosphoprotein PP28 domain-containing protein n=1 Tax=Allomyces macrogynus (strain ATCC 38327) TaxID=578462 RepID=A0A0L0T1A2_ALLM3|nr:hypothetical protein AMAG_13084 [Allomyces macrogynus ATCC 38327]|eukprot:KNE68430.1 hypothetical protein AMAG_13084 [Allomyces macrogynus ATCC 38327]